MLAGVPSGAALLVVIIFGAQAAGTLHASESMETIGWLAAAVVCIPPAASLEFAGVSRWNIQRVLACVGLAMAASFAVSGDVFRAACTAIAVGLLGLAIAGTLSKEPIASSPATRRYLQSLIGLSTLVSTVGFAALSIALLTRNP